ncbi:hypothetical protein BDK51DRAFT_38799 [Blyttiomyces helicus]|uniref:Uncharacterized protein n=1 Tax=Blyttiomyces helicus TaxID=388810 RepID=A0A4P9W5G1_9FUNG|nr:hypothetical protein BDK51DRAFT_38799 [Blyttiomyces helicus]|eukprot:RKO87639.1 hypothetical protein BDK51DRAFT_38799 [Blyttiomyces helicus]
MLDSRDAHTRWFGTFESRLSRPFQLTRGSGCAPSRRQRSCLGGQRHKQRVRFQTTTFAGIRGRVLGDDQRCTSTYAPTLCVPILDGLAVVVGVPVFVGEGMRDGCVRGLGRAIEGRVQSEGMYVLPYPLPPPRQTPDHNPVRPTQPQQQSHPHAVDPHVDLRVQRQPQPQPHPDLDLHSRQHLPAYQLLRPHDHRQPRAPGQLHASQAIPQPLAARPVVPARVHEWIAAQPVHIMTARDQAVIARPSESVRQGAGGASAGTSASGGAALVAKRSRAEPPLSAPSAQASPPSIFPIRPPPDNTRTRPYPSMGPGGPERAESRAIVRAPRWAHIPAPPGNALAQAAAVGAPAPLP